MDYRILPPPGLPEAEIRLPLSKSMSNRALLINALARQEAPSLQVATCDDTRVMQQALASAAGTIDIDGAGTAMRFLTAFFAATPGCSVILTGNDRMKHRPIAPLVDALRKCGANISYCSGEGYPPLNIAGSKLTGCEIAIDSTMSSQFASALLMIAPYMKGGITLKLSADTGSIPYIDMTLAMMREAGADAERENLTVRVTEGRYTKPIERVEADWSAAAFWYEIEAISSGFITLLGLDAQSIQGDSAASSFFARLAVNTEFSPDFEGRGPAAELTASPELSPRLQLDLSDHPDLTPAIAATCAMVGVPFRLTGLDTLRVKECDRLDAISRELRKVGVETEIIGNHTLEWTGRRMPLTVCPEFDTYGDHRMAMALAPISIFIPGIKIRNAEVVTKSYPQFWEHLTDAGFTIVDGDTPYESLFENTGEE